MEYHPSDQSQLIDILLALRVECFLFADRHIHKLTPPSEFPHDPAAVGYYYYFAFIPAVNTTKVSDRCHCYNVGTEFYVVIGP